MNDEGYAVRTLLEPRGARRVGAVSGLNDGSIAPHSCGV